MERVVPVNEKQQVFTQTYFIATHPRTCSLCRGLPLMSKGKGLGSRQELLDLIFHIFYIDYRSSRHPYVETINRLRHTVLLRTRMHPSLDAHTHL